MKYILLPLVFLLSLTPVCAVEYHGENTIFEDTVWQGEVLIDGILTIAMGATLEIRPGTRIRFTRIDSNLDGIGESEIFAQGRFMAVGTTEDPIIFTSAEKNPAPGDWGAINMMMSEEGENLFENCLVEYGYRGFHSHFSIARLNASTFRFNQRGAQFQESTVSISHCNFTNNFNGLQFRDSKVEIDNTRVLSNHWGIRAVFVELEMRGNTIESNLTNGVSLRDSKVNMYANHISDNRRGIYLQRSQGKISGNQITDNREHGIYLEESIADVQGNKILRNGRTGVKTLDSEGRIEDNSIALNGEFSFYNAGEDDFLVGPNWYGEKGRQAVLMDGLSRDGLGLLKLAPPLIQQPEVRTF